MVKIGATSISNFAVGNKNIDLLISAMPFFMLAILILVLVRII